MEANEQSLYDLLNHWGDPNNLIKLMSDSSIDTVTILVDKRTNKMINNLQIITPVNLVNLFKVWSQRNYTQGKMKFLLELAKLTEDNFDMDDIKEKLLLLISDDEIDELNKDISAISDLVNKKKNKDNKMYNLVELLLDDVSSSGLLDYLKNNNITIEELTELVNNDDAIFNLFSIKRHLDNKNKREDLINYFIYGKPKTGKTTLANKFDRKKYYVWDYDNSDDFDRVNEMITCPISELIGYGYEEKPRVIVHTLTEDYDNIPCFLIDVLKENNFILIEVK